MTNQSREAFDIAVLARELVNALESNEPCDYVDLCIKYRIEDTPESSFDLATAILQAALSEGRRLGLEKAAQMSMSMIGASRREITDAIRALMVGGGEGVCATASV